MDESRTIDKTMITRVLINKLEDEESPKEIRAKHIKDFESPDKIALKENNGVVVPDLVAFYDKEIHVYQIELDKSMPVDSWKILALYAKKNNGNLYLVVPDYNKEQVKKEIVKNDIRAGIIYFQTK